MWTFVANFVHTMAYVEHSMYPNTHGGPKNCLTRPENSH